MMIKTTQDVDVGAVFLHHRTKFYESWCQHYYLTKLMIEIKKDVDVEAVFLHPDEPALEFEGFLKKQYPRVRYFQVKTSIFLFLTFS